ncbi:glycosyltransferase [Siminovitchia sediminis]|uniref:Glycosyltransferase n=1 Tax=Siminovitchia sediminis TaxID=1274353 RepID=A0ABW4KER3_9BACI
MKKKVLFMLTSMNVGGVEKSLLSLLSALSKEEYEVTVLLLEKKGGFLEFIPTWVRVEEANWFKEIKPVILQPPQKTVKDLLHNKKIIKLITFIPTYFISKHFDNRYLYYKSVMKEIPQNDERYDVAVAYQGPTDIIDYYILNKVEAKRKISWVHFDVSKHKVNKKLYAKLYGDFNQVYTVSVAAKQSLVKAIPDIKNKTAIYKNHVQQDLIKTLAKKHVDFDEDFQGTRIVTVGRLSLEKGQDLAIRVLAKLRSEGYEVRWYCIGEGNARTEYERLIAKYKMRENFLLLGEKTNPYPYILRSDIYVQPSRHEGYCLTLAEAKCLQKPIVTTNFSGAYEQIDNGHNGYIVNTDIDQLYGKIKLLLDHQIQQEKFRLNLALQALKPEVRVHKQINQVI